MSRDARSHEGRTSQKVTSTVGGVRTITLHVMRMTRSEAMNGRHVGIGLIESVIYLSQFSNNYSDVMSPFPFEKQRRWRKKTAKPASQSSQSSESAAFDLRLHTNSVAFALLCPFAEKTVAVDNVNYGRTINHKR
jgi:hypothetical protein